MIPYTPTKLSGQSTEDFLQSWGYRKTGAGPESDANHQARTSRFAELIAAIWITSKRREEQSPNPFGIDHGWRFLINVLNNPPEPMYLNILDKILQIAGSTLHATFGKQFVKVMMSIRDQYIPSVSRKIDESSIATFNRLNTDRIPSFFQQNRFADPKGKLSANYW